MPAKPRRGDVVLLPFPFADLTTTKVRPALVLSSPLYHKSEPDIIVAALTSNVAAHQGPTDYTLQDWRAGRTARPFRGQGLLSHRGAFAGVPPLGTPHGPRP